MGWPVGRDMTPRESQSTELDGKGRLTCANVVCRKWLATEVCEHLGDYLGTAGEPSAPVEAHVERLDPYVATSRLRRVRASPRTG
jgi:hypothetical protein